MWTIGQILVSERRGGGRGPPDGGWHRSQGASHPSQLGGRRCGWLAPAEGPRWGLPGDASAMAGSRPRSQVGPGEERGEVNDPSSGSETAQILGASSGAEMCGSNRHHQM